MKKSGAKNYVSFHGTLPTDKLLSIYQRSHYLLHPSQSEGLSISMLEAMSCGCGVIAFSEMSVPEMLREVNVVTLLSDKNFPNAFMSDKVLYLEKWKSISEDAEKIVRDYFRLLKQSSEFIAYIQRIAE